MHPCHQQWKEANMQEWKRADLVLEAPEMRQVGQRCAVTANGTEIGRSHINKPKASAAGSVSGPHRPSQWKQADWWIYRVMLPLGIVTVGALLLAEGFA